MIALLVRLLNQRNRQHITALLVTAAACVLVGGWLFALTQDLPFTTGLYWAITTATTVGYGDVTPHNGIGRLISSAVMLTAIPLLAAVFALVTGGAAAAGIRRILSMESHFPEGTYRLVVGMNPTVPAILEELKEAGIPVVLAADVERDSVRHGVHLVRGDPTEPSTISAAKPRGAQQALLCGSTDGDVLVSAVILRKQAPDLPITALVTSAAVREALHELGIQHAVSAQELVARTLAMSLETPHASELIAQLVESGRDLLDEVDADPGMVGRALSAIRDERGGLVLGFISLGDRGGGWEGRSGSGGGLAGGGEALALAPGTAAVEDHPGDQDGRHGVGHHLGDGQRGAGRGGLDDDDPGRGFGQICHAPDHGEQPEDMAEAGVLPQALEVPAARGVRAHELEREPEDKRPARPQRASAGPVRQILSWA